MTSSIEHVRDADSDEVAKNGPIEVLRAEPQTTSAGGVVHSHIPVFWIQSDTVSAAGIVFQAGRGFEVAAASGVTHLIRHIVSANVGLAAHGPFDPYLHDVTGFSFEGPSSQLVADIAELSLSLSVIPLDHLAAAREAVKSEAEGWHPSAVDQLMRVRHGIQGPGATCLPEYGIRKVGEKQLTMWTNRYFHSDNAAIWHVGPEPAPFHTRLVRGVKPRSLPAPLPVPTPGAIYGPQGEVCLSILVPRDLAGSAIAHIAELRAADELVKRRGVSQTVIFGCERRSPWVSEIIGFADATDGRDDEVARVMLWALDSLVHEPASDEELDDFRSVACQPYFDRTDLPTFAMEHAVGLVTKTPMPSWAEMYGDLCDLKSEDVASTVEDAMSTILIVGSRACTVLPERFEYVGGWAPTNVEGAQVRPIPVEGEEDLDRSLVFGPDGMVVREQDRVATVRFTDCSLMLRDEGNYRELISSMGSRAVFISDAWENGEKLLKIIDKQIPIERTIMIEETKDTRGGYVGFERRRWPR